MLEGLLSISHPERAPGPFPVQRELEAGAESCSQASSRHRQVLQFITSACKPVAKEISSFIRKNSGFENDSFLS